MKCSAKAQVSSQDRNLPIHTAAEEGDLIAIAKILEEYPADVNATNRVRLFIITTFADPLLTNLLILYVLHNHRDIVRLFIWLSHVVCLII